MVRSWLCWHFGFGFTRGISLSVFIVGFFVVISFVVVVIIIDDIDITMDF